MQQFRKALAIWSFPQSWVLLDQLAGALLGHNGPALVEFPVPRQELSMPPTITLEQAKGFSVFMMKQFSVDAATRSLISPVLISFAKVTPEVFIEPD